MKRFVCVVLALAAFNGIALAQNDTVKVLVWDNDAGEPPQTNPGCFIDNSSYSYFAWTDWRYKSAEIEGQRFSGSFAPVDTNFLVNDNTADGRTQANTVIAGTDTGSFFIAWEEDSTSSVQVIYGRRFNHLCQPLSSTKIKISKNEGSGYGFTAFSPAIDVDHATGRAVAAWTQATPSGSRIFARVWTGTAWLDTVRVDNPSAGGQGNPAVAIHDTFIVVTWNDTRNGSGDIYARLFNYSLQPRGASFLVNNVTADSIGNQVRPAIAISCTTDPANCYYAIAWENYYPYMNNYHTNIKARQYSTAGAPGNIQMVNITTATPNRRPDIAMGPRSKTFITCWEDSTDDTGKYNIKVRMYDNTYFTGAIKRVNSDTAGNQTRAKIDFNGTYAVVAWLDSSRAGGKGDIFTQWFTELSYGTDRDSLGAHGLNTMVNSGDKLRANGRQVQYHYPDYDNAGTSGWNENPRPSSAPDSIKIPLDSAYVLALKARNIMPWQSFIKVTDTDTLLARSGQKLNGVADYDLCVMDLGYAESALSAGTIDKAQQDSLKAFSDSGGALLCSGNDFGEYYGTTALFGLFGAVYDGPGNPSATGNIDSLVGVSGAFTRGMVFDYPYQQAEDNSVDIIHASTAGDTLFMSGGPAKWMYSRGMSYSSYFKGGKGPTWHNNVYLPFSMGALSSSGKHPNTVTELTRRILAFQGFNVEPEPICDLAADTTTSAIEGTVTLRWAAVSDDTLSERAARYQLMISEYNAALPEYGKFTSEAEYYGLGQTYYQIWTPAAVASNEVKTIYLAPGKSYIFALKAGDESTPTLWSALGSEPMSQTRGDTLTPHTLYVGNSYGLVNQFASSELLDTDNGDTLYFTWDASNLFFGFSRKDWRTQGDLFVYLDTKTGGADSTIGDWNGAAADTAALFDEGGNFKPDFCFALDSLGSKCKLMYWTGTAWAESIATYSPSYYTLDLLNNTLLTTIRIPRSKIGSPASLKFDALRLYETSEACYSSFPPDNPSGTKGAKAISRYPFFYNVPSLASGLSPRNAAQPLAVELSQFSASAGRNAVTLSWNTSSETDNYQWLIERSREPDQNYARIAAIPTQGGGAAGHSYGYTDNTVQENVTYYYLLGDQDLSGAITWNGPVSVVVPGVSITALSLHPATPNPARHSADIRFSLPQDGPASLAVYDICGRKVRTLRAGIMATGAHVAAWDGKDDAGRAVATGVYFYKLRANGQQLTRKLAMIR